MNWRDEEEFDIVNYFDQGFERSLFFQKVEKFSKESERKIS